MSRFEVIRGVEGLCLTLDDTRIAGPKPWGGGTVVHAWDTEDVYAKVETCEQGDFDSIREALIWLLQERDDVELGSGTLTAEQVRETVLKHGKPRFYGDWKEIADELNATLGSGTCETEARS
jgi:hypothetical protein